MRVCLLSKMFPPVVGGSSMYAYEIANALGERGHDVDVYTQSKEESRDAFETHDNVSVTTLTKARRYLVTFETLYYSLRARLGVDFDDYDVVHGTLMPASTIALSDRLTFDTPLVLTSHSFALSEVFAHSPVKPADYLLKYAFHPMNVVMDNIAGRRADRVVAISEEMREQLTSTYRFDGDRVTRVSHGVDTARYRPREKRHEAASEDRLTLLFVGRLVSRKGADLAIDALVATDREDVELLVAGTGRLKDDLKQRARKRGVHKRVKFLGYVPDERLPVLYSSADATLFTPNYEGFGLVFMESLASGTPVIGAPVGGFPDLVTDGREGFIINRTASDVARAAETLAESPERAQEMGERARALAESRTWDIVAEETEAVYEDVLAEAGPDSRT